MEKKTSKLKQQNFTPENAVKMGDRWTGFLVASFWGVFETVANLHDWPTGAPP